MTGGNKEMLTIHSNSLWHIMKQGLNWVVESMKVEKQSRFLRAEGWGRMQWAVGIQGEGNDIHSNYLSNRPWISWTFLVTSSKTQLKWAQVKKKKKEEEGTSLEEQLQRHRLEDTGQSQKLEIWATRTFASALFVVLHSERLSPCNRQDSS